MASKSLLARILQPQEMQVVLKDLRLLAGRSESGRQRLAFFRLCACCGMRASEVGGLQVRDIHPYGPCPEINVRAEIAKGNKPRSIPLSWDEGTRTDLARWLSLRAPLGPETPFLKTMAVNGSGVVTRNTAFKWWKKAIAILGPRRVQQIGGPHSGRHTFCTHALAGGRTLGEVRDAAGHSSVGVTDIYIHAMPRRNVQDLWKEPNPVLLYEDLDEKQEAFYNHQKARA